MSFSLIISSFIAGLLTFFAPCTFPLLPAYISIISGDLSREEKQTGRKQLNKKVIINSFAYITGFSSVFIFFGLLAGSIGQVFPSLKDWLARVGGLVVIIFGLYLLGIFKLSFLSRSLKINFGDSLKPGSTKSSFILGLSVAAGWSPCVGPIVGSIFLLAANSSTALQGAFLLMIFSTGLAVPFLFFALLASSANNIIQGFSKILKYVNYIGGVMMLTLGFFLITNRFVQLIGYGYKILEFIGLDNITKYL
ncbi:sulfite exporter TauE/SafE family protein [Candidatus Nomurabacteria bacterium]|nr:sulfite exporter TauE/SafE family protein [Candidatus Nomurabacteria bacterium]